MVIKEATRTIAPSQMMGQDSSSGMPAAKVATAYVESVEG